LRNRNEAEYSEVDECDIVVTGFGEREMLLQLVREGKMFVKDKAKILEERGPDL